MLPSVCQLSGEVRGPELCLLSHNKQGKNWHPRLLLTSTHAETAAVHCSQVQVAWVKTNQHPNTRILCNVTFKYYLDICISTDMDNLRPLGQTHLADPWLHLNPWQWNIYLWSLELQNQNLAECSAAAKIDGQAQSRSEDWPEVLRSGPGPGNLGWPRPRCLNTRAVTTIRIICCNCPYDFFRICIQF